MRPVRLSLILLAALLGASVAACTVRNERTVYTPARATAAPTVTDSYSIAPGYSD